MLKSEGSYQRWISCDDKDIFGPVFCMLVTVIYVSVEMRSMTGTLSTEEETAFPPAVSD